MKSLFPARHLAPPFRNRQPALGSGNMSVFRIAAFRLLSLSARGLIPRLPQRGRAVKFFSEQRQFRFRVFRARDSVPCLSAFPRLCGRQNILSQRRRGAETGTQSSLILKLPELSAGDCLRQAQAAPDTG